MKKAATASQNCYEALKNPENNMTGSGTDKNGLPARGRGKALDREYVLIGLMLNAEKCAAIRRVYTRTGKPLEADRPPDDQTTDAELVGIFIDSTVPTGRSSCWVKSWAYSRRSRKIADERAACCVSVDPAKDCRAESVSW
ncbi:MAG: hypothetical protein U5K56_09910 [Halioglobus sp.]|nr:hypothetical protein [Halioglobus sp.]